MASDTLIPDTRVLAIASHVVHGYVGNKMATLVMQSLGCDVSAINTVHYSNHTAYKQVKGSKTSADQILELYEGLRQSSLNNFDLLLTGYMPSAECVQAVGKIGRDIKFNAGTKPGSFFWVLDPVMGDNGKLYIPEDEVPEYKTLLREADLILPNQFEAELLSDTTITDLTSLAAAIQVLHKTYRVPHVIITSLRLTRDNHTLPSRAPSRAPSKSQTPTETPKLDPATTHPQSWPASNPTSSSPSLGPVPSLEEIEEPENLTIIGSTATSDHKPRLFRIDTPALPLFFSGTGDMFAALTIPRLIEAVHSSSTPDLASKPSWRSPDEVKADELPLAKACQKVLASMQAILTATTENCAKEMDKYDARAKKEGHGQGDEDTQEREKRRHLALMNASEVKVPRFIKEINEPPHLDKFKPRAVEEAGNVSDEVGRIQPDELNVLHPGLGGTGDGSLQVLLGKEMGEKVGALDKENEARLAGEKERALQAFEEKNTADQTKEKPEEKTEGKSDEKAVAVADESAMHDTEVSKPKTTSQDNSEDRPKDKPAEKANELKENPEETLEKPEVKPEEPDTGAADNLIDTSGTGETTKSLESEMHGAE